MKKGISREKCAASLLAHLHNIVSQLPGFSTPSFFSLMYPHRMRLIQTFTPLEGRSHIKLEPNSGAMHRWSSGLVDRSSSFVAL